MISNRKVFKNILWSTRNIFIPFFCHQLLPSPVAGHLIILHFTLYSTPLALYDSLHASLRFAIYTASVEAGLVAKSTLQVCYREREGREGGIGIGFVCFIIFTDVARRVAHTEKERDIHTLHKKGQRMWPLFMYIFTYIYFIYT